MTTLKSFVVGPGTLVALLRNPRLRAWGLAFVLSAVLLVALATQAIASFLALLLINILALVAGWSWNRTAYRSPQDQAAPPAFPPGGGARDGLTGLLDRRSFIERTGEVLEWPGARKYALAILDVDGFRTVNDLHGHLIGDNLLRSIAEGARTSLPSSIIGRLGADQFAALIPDEDGKAAAAVATLVEDIGRPADLGGARVHVTVSAGMARAGDEEVEALIRRADIAMRAAKSQGRGRSLWFNETMQRELHSRNELEAALRHAIPNGELVPYFEKQINLGTGALEGFEMLARWKRPGHGLLAPDAFIALAENCGLIGDLSLSVMRQAMTEARGWDNSLRLSVNISPVQLKDPWLAQKIAKLLNETGFPADRLEVEITESSLLENIGLVQAIVTSLKNQGIRLALDDFGTGFSSLAHLRVLPFDRIKIDRSFVMSINDNPESAAIVTAITRLTESLNLAVTAEGIENSAIEERLRDIGSYCGQGWALGKPMPLEDVRALLAGEGLLPARRDFFAASRSGTRDGRFHRLA